MFKYKFIDLFAGIGGFHIALHNLGCECVFASEWDSDCRKTYVHNLSKISPEIFNDESELFIGDITKINPEIIPDHDILCAGFPCQPFSQAGQKKGFEDTRGTLFFNVASILKIKQPKAFFLENVRGLLTHDSGKTFEIIRNTIEELGYDFYYKIIKASDFNLPQHRPRLYMVGFKKELKCKFEFPNPVPLTVTMNDIFECQNVNKKIGFTLRVGGKGSPINDRRNWDGYLVDGVERRLTPVEGRKMQGFPDWYEFPVSNTAAMKQLGNSVAVPAVQAVAEKIIISLEKSDNMSNLNRGEWSEVYAIMSMLLNPDLSIVDNHLEEITNQLYSINKIKVYPNTGVFEYNLNNNKEVEVYFNENYDNLISRLEIENNKNLILESILNSTSRNGAFAIEGIGDILYKMTKGAPLKSKSKSKEDLEVVVLDKRLGKDKKLMYSIKSSLGSPATILNSSSQTNFLYEIDDLDAKFIEEINNIDSKSKLLDRINFIVKNGGKIKFKKVESSTLDYNLRLIDSNMPNYLGNALLNSYCGKTKNLKENFLASNVFDDEIFAIKKLEDLLEAISFGFIPSEKWNGQMKVNGGLVIVKKDGTIVVLDLVYFRNEVITYIINETKFETPSSSRYKMLNLYKNDETGKIEFTLNLQLRYNK